MCVHPERDELELDRETPVTDFDVPEVSEPDLAPDEVEVPAGWDKVETSV